MPSARDAMFCCLAIGLAMVSAHAKSAAPTLENPGPQYSFDGHEVALPIPAEAPAQVALVFRATGLPEGLHIDPATGMISGTVEAPGSLCTQVAVYVEAGGQTAETRFDWVVESKGVLSCGGGAGKSGGSLGGALGVLMLTLTLLLACTRQANRYLP